jgi:hypothetical protein
MIMFHYLSVILDHFLEKKTSFFCFLIFSFDDLLSTMRERTGGRETGRKGLGERRKGVGERRNGVGERRKGVHLY